MRSKITKYLATKYSLTPRVWYKFQGDLNDYSGNALHASNSTPGMVFSTIGGKQAGYFTNETQWVQMPTFALGANFCISFQIYLPTYTGWSGNGEEIRIAVIPNSSTGFQIDHVWNLNNHQDPGNTVQATPMAFNTWHHVAAQRQATIPTIYANGALKQTGPASTNTAQNMAAPTVGRYINDNGANGAMTWPGTIYLRNLRVYSRALTAAEMTLLMSE
jgi:Concanavalin A-like lectin/glucanases superfamily